MEQDKQQRHVKVVGDATHRVGAPRAAVKPHRRTQVDVGQIITTYVAGLKRGSLTQTYVGDTLAKNDRLIRSSFGLASGDDLYLLADPTGTGKAGMLLASSGLHLADGRGGRSAMTWKEVASCKVTCQRGMLILGQSGIATKDAQALLALIKQIQAKLAA